MLGFTIFLGVINAIFILALHFLGNKNMKLTVESSLMKDRMEALLQRIAEKEAVAPQDPLTVDGIEEAIRHAGYVPEREENWIRFMVAGEPFYVEAGRLPSVFVFRHYRVDTKEWEMDLLRQAAHLMSDELIMIKATFDEDKDDTGLNFFIAALDANNASFRENLCRYIGIIEDGSQRMNEIYDQLVKEKRDAALALNPFIPENPSEKKVLS